MEKEKANTKAKKFWSLLKDWLHFITVVFLIFVAVYFTFNYVPFFANRRQFVVLTDSMEPTINVGDIVVIDTSYNLDDLQVGNIIAFYADLNEDGTNEVIVHYIAQITTNTEEQRIFLTHREGVTNESSWDQWEITDDLVIGKFDFKVKYLGRILLFAESWFGKIIIIVDIIVISLIYDFMKYSITAEKAEKKRLLEEQPKPPTELEQIKQNPDNKKLKEKIKTSIKRKNDETKS
jgi:signal peptidase